MNNILVLLTMKHSFKAALDLVSLGYKVSIITLNPKHTQVKKISGYIKLQIPAGKANPAPPVGTALGPKGVNIMGFCKEFNARTQKQIGSILPTVITVYADKSFSFITKSPPASDLLKKAASLKKGSQTPGTSVAGSVTKEQVSTCVIHFHVNRHHNTKSCCQ